MKLTALVTSFALGISSLAMADVALTTAASETQVGSWIALTEPMPLSRGRDVVKLQDKRKGDKRAAYSQLRIQATQGSSHIERVIVRFTDGTTQGFDLEAKLDASTPIVQFSIGVTSRTVEELIVIGASSRRSAVQLFGV